MAVLLRMNFHREGFNLDGALQWRMRVQIKWVCQFFIVTAKQVPAQMLKTIKRWRLA